MKVLHFSSFDQVGGAARATERLHMGLTNLGVESKLAVQWKSGFDQNTIEVSALNIYGNFRRKLRPHIDALPLISSSKDKRVPWSISWLNNDLSKIYKACTPDLIHFHWINAGFLSLKNLYRAPVNSIVTLHDSWIFTGGCHVPASCLKYKHGCGACPQLNNNIKYDLSFFGVRRKAKHMSNKKIVFVAPSRWMASAAKSSLLLGNSVVEVIPNGLDLEIFYPQKKQFSRRMLKLPSEKKIILFGAIGATDNPNKGFIYFQKAMEILEFQSIKLNVKLTDIHLVFFGNSSRQDCNFKFNFPTTYLGEIKDQSILANIYSAADLICVPSIQESFCQVASEATACGLPVVAFATSGLLDVVDHNLTGYLARPYDANDLAYGMGKLLSGPTTLQEMSSACVIKAKNNFDIKVIAQKHKELYEKCIRNLYD